MKAMVDPDWRHKTHKFAAGDYRPTMETLRDLADAYTGGSLTQLFRLDAEVKESLDGADGPTVVRCPALDAALGRARESR
jgi:tRNA A37 threonylcarbamoyladenosine synthetase subunit TsaC/SUA5/YrdC